MPSITERQPGSTRITSKNEMQKSQGEQLHGVANAQRNKKVALNGSPKPQNHKGSGQRRIKIALPTSNETACQNAAKENVFHDLTATAVSVVKMQALLLSPKWMPQTDSHRARGTAAPGWAHGPGQHEHRQGTLLTSPKARPWDSGSGGLRWGLGTFIFKMFPGRSHGSNDNWSNTLNCRNVFNLPMKR